MDLRKEVLEYCSELGLNKVGFIKCRKFYELIEFYKQRKDIKVENEFEEQDIDIRINPNHYMDEGKTIISIAFPYLYINKNNDTGFSVYTRGYDYHRVVNEYLNKICEFIESKGGEALPFVDSSTLPERYIAYLSGIGFIGKNNMLITKEYGSYVFLGEIITDLEIYEEDKADFESLSLHRQCGECEICFKECPTKSINRNRKNPNICLSYLTQKKELSDWEIKALNGRIFGCDSCQYRCPFNEKIEESFIDGFKPLEFMNEEKVDYIIEMGNADFKSTFKNTSCGWRGKNVLKRNAIIRKALYNGEDISSIKTDSDYIKNYVNRLL